MNQPYGAHELMEIHEVLTDTIDGINQFQLYQPHCQDPQLRSILEKQINFMVSEYDTMVQAVQQRDNQSPVSYRSVRKASPTYGVNNTTSAERPNTSMNQLNDQDISSGMLGCSKASATMRMHAALECADPQIRNLFVQGAKNCAEQAYETWQYMNSKGYYQVPTLQANTTQAMLNHYQPSNFGQQTYMPQ